MQALNWRNVFGIVVALGAVLPIGDLLTIGRGELRPARVATQSA